MVVRDVYKLAIGSWRRLDGSTSGDSELGPTKVREVDPVVDGLQQRTLLVVHGDGVAVHHVLREEQAVAGRRHRLRRDVTKHLVHS